MKEDVRYWFDQAAELPSNRRDAFLQSHCTDEAVRHEVRSLLAYDELATSSDSVAKVQDAIAQAIGTVPGPWSSPVQRVGPFELGRVLGSGGMGFVYEAHRVDGQVRQRVAVKFAQVSFTASEQLREKANRRFHREREMLASLRHPYIAGLIDAGTTQDGIPYAVIEQVDGVPIDTYCDQHLLDVEDRIRLILKLCDAVQCAHRNLIIHSDIKPENVLVTADGIPRLIDFGVASDLADDSSTATMRAFTPGYASPEQLCGLPTTVATDVYGLGAVLYRLFTGICPHHRQQQRSTPIDDVVPPSALKSELRGDLENILLKALHQEPQRRYGSVPEFADDLNRFLGKRPVRATPDSTLYRTSRLIRRHWAFVLIALMLVAVLTGSTVVAFRQREQAMRRANETRRLAGKLLFEVHDEIGEIVGATKARETLSTMAVQYLEQLQRGYEPDPELAWELLNAYSRLGQSRGGAASSVGDTQSAIHLANKTLELGAVVEAAAPNADRVDRLFTAYQRLVAIFEEAQKVEQRDETVQRLMRLAPRLSELRRAQALKEHARLLQDRGSQIEAASVFARAADLLTGHGKDPASEWERTTILVNLGRSQAWIGDLSGAVISLEKAIELSSGHTAADPHLVRNARQLYWSHLSLGDILGLPLRFNLRRTAEAAAHYQAARRIAEKLVNADPANEMARIDLARVLGREGAALATTQPQQALDLLERCRSVLLQNSSRNHSNLDIRLAWTTSSVLPLIRLGRLDQARQQIEAARQVLAEMRAAGIRIEEKPISKIEAALLHASGKPLQALELARRQLAIVPQKISNVLSENYELVEVLERIQTYAASVEPATCTATGDRLTGIWQSLQSTYPQSSFIRAETDRARASNKAVCLTTGSHALPLTARSEAVPALHPRHP